MASKQEGSPHQRSFVNKIGFKNIHLFKDQLLGIGAYGKVCKARCDHLECAAKILHPTLFNQAERLQIASRREHRLPMSRFEQECELMGALRHPNIVQYLGITQEPDIHLPVLLMELMDESLTHFLNRASQPIPYHIGVNVCHDVTLALEFLHSNNIVHRDLSSNNVLLIGNGIRAKVTDFGMARLADLSLQPSHVSFTLCPGTEVYMPPEAVKDKPEYTEKLDCFSFGVLTIQMLSRQFPKPGGRLKNVDMSIPGTFVVSVSEKERRQNHISLVEKDHPLLLVALDCLNDKASDRPTANELCQRLSDLKENVKYRENLKASQEKDEEEIRKKDEEIELMKQEHAREVKKFKDVFESQEIRLKEVDRRMDEQEREVTKKEGVIIKQSLLIYQKEQTISRNSEEHGMEIKAKEVEIDDLRHQLHQATTRGRDIVVSDLNQRCAESQQILAQNEERLRQKNWMIRSKEVEVRTLSQQLAQMTVQVRNEEHAKEEKAKELAVSEDLLSKFQKRIDELETQIKAKDEAIGNSRRLSAQQDSTVPPIRTHTQPLRGEPNFSGHIESGRIKDHTQQHADIAARLRDIATGIGNMSGKPAPATTLRLKFRKGEKLAPKMMSRGPDPIINGEMVFFTPSMTVGGAPIYCYNSVSKAWYQLVNYPYCMNGMSLAILQGFLTGIGGTGDNGYTDKLFSFQADITKGVQKWIEVFPPLPTKRASTCALVIGGKLIVIGGENGTTSSLTSAVIMDIDSHQWYASRLELPAQVKNASITIHGGRVYILGGWIDKRSVYTCPIRDLIEPKSSKPLPFPTTRISQQEGVVGNKWSRVADLPVDYSTCVSFNGHLLAIGGEDSNNNSTTAIHVYDPLSNSWKLTNHLLTGRTACFAVVLPNNQLMVVGGWTKRMLLLLKALTNDIEFGTLEAV